MAADLFTEEGFGQTSVRDIARRANVTSGAIYGQFRDKSDLLAEVIREHVARELDAQCQMVKRQASHVEALAELGRQFRQRRRLRSLILQGAAAAHSSQETLATLREQQLAQIEVWTAEYESHRERLGIDPSVDVHTAVLYTWAAEVGLGILEAFDIAPDDPENGPRSRPE